jgi:zinc D-Ala-D-Ala dipeptidase
MFMRSKNYVNRKISLKRSQIEHAGQEQCITRADSAQTWPALRMRSLSLRADDLCSGTQIKRGIAILLLLAAAFLFTSLDRDEAIAGERSVKSHLVYLRAVDPTILQDMRYATINNFTGEKVPGYDAAECMLLADVAEALARVQTELRKSNLSLKVYDCYRPRRAVQAFVKWAGARRVVSIVLSPVKKKDLVLSGYIAAVSTHSRGIAVDLTVVSIPEPVIPRFDPGTQYGPCTGRAGERAPDDSLDMGTGFDCFDPLSNTSNPQVSETQLKSRQLLVDVMAQHGFKNYPREWWHFILNMLAPGKCSISPLELPRQPFRDDRMSSRFCLCMNHAVAIGTPNRQVLKSGFDPVRIVCNGWT